MPTKASGYIKVFLIVLLAACTLADEVDPNYSYNDFMRQYNRTYTGEERAIHEQIFNRKYAELLKLRSQGHELAVNQFLDWTPEQEAGTYLLIFSFFHLSPRAIKYYLVLKTSSSLKRPFPFKHTKRFRLEKLRQSNICKKPRRMWFMLGILRNSSL